MFYSVDYFASVLPDRDPPPSAVPEEVRAAYGQHTDSLSDELLRRSGFWTHALFSELRQGEIRLEEEISERFQRGRKNQPPDLALFRTGVIAVGLHDPEFEGPGFGLSVAWPYVERSETVARVRFPRLEMEFPLAFVGLAQDAHSAPRLLSNASSACWAQDNTRLDAWGFVTCRHAVGGWREGTPVALVSGGKAWIARKAPPTIDATFMLAERLPPGIRGRLRLLRFPTAGLSVTVATPHGIEQRSVIRVTDTLGVVSEPLFPITIFLDQGCQPGDSGSLVATHTDEGVALYLGELSGATINGRTGQTAGYAQHLEQAVIVLGVSPYV